MMNRNAWLKDFIEEHNVVHGIMSLFHVRHLSPPLITNLL